MHHPSIKVRWHLQWTEVGNMTYPACHWHVGALTRRTAKWHYKPPAAGGAISPESPRVCLIGSRESCEITSNDAEGPCSVPHSYISRCNSVPLHTDRRHLVLRTILGAYEYYYNTQLRMSPTGSRVPRQNRLPRYPTLAMAPMFQIKHGPPSAH